MPDINVVNEVVTQTPDIKKVDTPKPEHATSEPAAKPEKSQKGIKVSDALAVNDISNQDTLDQETTLDYEDAQLATSFEALNYNQSKSLADTWKFISDDITERLPVQSSYAQGVDTGELLNLYNPKETSTLKNLTAGFVEAPAQTAKVIDSLLIWGGALTSKLGVKTLGERMMQFGASNISNIDYMLKEYGFQDVNRESISYGVGGTISDILTSIGAAGMLSKASAKYTTKAMAKESAALAAKEAEGEVAKISLKKTLTSPEALKLYQHAERLNKWSRRAPFAFMMGKDIGSMLLSREEQYMNKDAGFMETDKFMDNFWKETTAVGTDNNGLFSSVVKTSNTVTIRNNLTTETGEAVCFLTEDFQPYAVWQNNYHTSATQPDDQTGAVWFNGNVFYQNIGTNDSPNWKQKNLIPCFNYSVNQGTVTQFKGYEVSKFNSYQDFELAEKPLPSNNFINLTLGASGTIYTVPANGWINMSVNLAVNNYMAFFNKNSVNVSELINMQSAGINQNYTIGFPIRAGQKFRVQYSAYNNLNSFRFYFAQGEL